MANIKKLVPKILKWEGGFGWDKADPGGATMKGITLATFRSVFGQDKTVDDLKNISDEQWMHVLKLLFWDKWKADEIKSQSIAEMLVDWVWASGAHGIKEVQRAFGLKTDGVVGPKTLSVINDHPNQKALHDLIFDLRIKFIDRIVLASVNKYKQNNPNATEKDLKEWTFLRFEQGWKNRLFDSYVKFEA